jgi:hypothetical protein
MTKLYLEIKNILDSDNKKDVINKFFWGAYLYRAKEIPELEELINASFKIVDSYGGEDQGIEYWKVYKFTRDQETCYIKFDGSYVSYDGSTFDRFYEVEPREVKVTVYESISS